MEIGTQTSNVKSKVFARVTLVEDRGTQMKLTFQDAKGEEYYKTIRCDQNGLDTILHNVGVASFQELPHAMSRMVQLALIDGSVAYINEVDQKTGKVVFNAPKPKPAPIVVTVTNEDLVRIQEPVTFADADSLPSMIAGVSFQDPLHFPEAASADDVTTTRKLIAMISQLGPEEKQALIAVARCLLT